MLLKILLAALLVPFECIKIKQTLEGSDELESNSLLTEKIDWTSKQIDAVSPVHQNDVEITIYHAIPSWFKFMPELRNVYLIATRPAADLVRKCLKSGPCKHTIPDGRLFIVDQELFDFHYDDVKAVANKSTYGLKDMNGWTYQQVLKLYAGRFLYTDASKHNIAQILPSYLVVDGENIFMSKVIFLDQVSSAPPRGWYDVAGIETGTYENDVLYGAECAKSLLGDKILLASPKATSSCRGLGEPSLFQKRLTSSTNSLTAITHHMFMQVDVLDALLRTVEDTSGKAAWQALSVVSPFLSEYELYLTWTSIHFPDRISLRALAYVNAGKDALPSDRTDIGLKLASKGGFFKAQTDPPLVYATFHDEYPRDFHCCVNTVPDPSFTCGTCSSQGNHLRTEGVPRLQLCLKTVYSENPNRSHICGANLMSDFERCLKH